MCICKLLAFHMQRWAMKEALCVHNASLKWELHQGRGGTGRRLKGIVLLILMIGFTIFNDPSNIPLTKASS